jgi:hypothetical protein
MLRSIGRTARAWLAALGQRAAAPAIGTVAGVGVAAAIMLTPPLAEAKASYESPYGYDRTWNSALRYIRVDQGYKVTEKDEANGYLLFDYKSAEGGKTTSGSLEVVRGKDTDSPVTVVVQLPKMPRYHEQVLVDGLSTKMRAEYGDPPARKKKPPEQAPETPDGGADAGS